MKKWWIVFGLNGKELAAYTAAGTFLDEAENTRALLAFENKVKPEEITISKEYR